MLQTIEGLDNERRRRSVRPSRPANDGDNTHDNGTLSSSSTAAAATTTATATTRETPQSTVNAPACAGPTGSNATSSATAKEEERTKAHTTTIEGSTTTTIEGTTTTTIEGSTTTTTIEGTTTRATTGQRREAAAEGDSTSSTSACSTATGITNSTVCIITTTTIGTNISSTNSCTTARLTTFKEGTSAVVEAPLAGKTISTVTPCQRDDHQPVHTLHDHQNQDYEQDDDDDDNDNDNVQTQQQQQQGHNKRTSPYPTNGADAVIEESRVSNQSPASNSSSKRPPFQSVTAKITPATCRVPPQHPLYLQLDETSRVEGVGQGGDHPCRPRPADSESPRSHPAHDHLQESCQQPEPLHQQQQQQPQQQLSRPDQPPSLHQQVLLNGGAHWCAAEEGMPRSPSHESFATDLSLLSLSSCGSEVSRIVRCEAAATTTTTTTKTAIATESSESSVIPTQLADDDAFENRASADSPAHAIRATLFPATNPVSTTMSSVSPSASASSLTAATRPASAGPGRTRPCGPGGAGGSGAPFNDSLPAPIIQVHDAAIMPMAASSAACPSTPLTPAADQPTHPYQHAEQYYHLQHSSAASPSSSCSSSIVIALGGTAGTTNVSATTTTSSRLGTGVELSQRRSTLPYTTSTSGRSGPTSLLQVPSETYRGGGGGGGSRVHDASVLFEEESEAIRNCSLLSFAVLGGLMKSFSTGDISCSLEMESPENLRNTVSEELLVDGGRNTSAWANLEVPANRRLECASRSCSTWVAVGDMHSAQSTSQLPSPSARCGSGNIPGFTAADLVRSVNKKVRQMYIRRRLLSTYKALERLTKSQLNLSEALQATGPHDLKKNIQAELRLTSSTSVAAGRANGRKTPLTARDVERDRGKPLTKYERNMMIFNWLHNLDDEDESASLTFEVTPANGAAPGAGGSASPHQPVQQAAA